MNVKLMIQRDIPHVTDDCLVFSSTPKNGYTSSQLDGIIAELERQELILNSGFFVTKSARTAPIEKVFDLAKQYFAAIGEADPRGMALGYCIAKRYLLVDFSTPGTVIPSGV